MSAINTTTPSSFSEAQIASWRQYLRDAPPSAFPRRPNMSTIAAPTALIRRKVILPRKRAGKVSLETVIQTAWALVNVYYSDTDDVVYGLAVVGESDEEDETGEETSLNALPARFTLQGSQTVAACLKAVEEQELPLTQVALADVAALGPDMATSAKFDNQLVIFSDMMGTQDVQLDRAMNIECTLSRQGVMARAFYDPSVVDAAQMQRVLSTFESLIHQLSDPAGQSKALDQLNLVSAEDMAQICEWNKELCPAVDRCMHDLIAEQVKAHPHNEAVCGLDFSITYAQLDDMTDKLAHILVSKGIRAGRIVPFMFEKSPMVPIATLATLKAGGAFVPLDPAHQWADTAGLLEACEASLVICSKMHEQRFKDHGVSAVVLDQVYLDSLPSRGPVSASVEPTDPGYVIFTSGSTGKPKGIVCSHGAWCTNAVAHGTIELMGPTTRLMQFSAYTFDISISDIFTTLAFGGCVCHPTDAERLNDLTGAIKRMQVTQLIGTPTVVQFIKPEDVPTLQILVTGGEAMSPEFVATWADKVKLMNSYGPAETTSRCCCTWKTLEDEGAVIGRANGGSLWVTESNNPNRLVPIGAVGELLVEGPILANGYLKNEAKTREAFIAKPEWLRKAFPDRASGMVYRTGDLVQYTSDGQFRFLGRRDTQIKIHGVRLEAGAIESKILTQLPQDSTVVVEKIYAGEEKKQLLAAFLTVPHLADSQPGGFRLLENSSDIRSFVSGLQRTLLDTLPSYMVPNVFLPVSVIPLGATGKVNRRLLQATAKEMPFENLNQYAAGRTGDVTEAEKPAGAMESTVAGLWAKVLKISVASIGREDTFFTLGGDSVAAMKLVSAAAEADISLTVGEIFQFSKLSDLAVHLGGSATGPVAELEPIEPFVLIGGVAKFSAVRDVLAKSYKIPARRVEDIYPCTPMQEGMMAETISTPEAYLLQEVLKLPRNVDLDRLQTVWEDLSAAHPILRTRIVNLRDLGSCQVIMTESEPIVWEEVENLDEFLAEDKQMHMGYGDVLSRFAVVEEPNGDKFLVWTVHHAVTDGHMNQDMLRRVESVYNNGGAGITHTTGFNHFIQYLGAKDAAVSRQFFKEQYVGLSGAQFPVFDESYEPSITRYITHDMTLPRESLGFTSSILIRAAWAYVLSQVTSSTDIVIGVTQSGRDVALQGVDECLGPCLATVPVRITLGPTQTTGQFVSKVQKQYIDMIPHQHAGLQHIRKASAEAAEACGFHNLLVVQPAAGEPSALLAPTDKRNAGDSLNFGLLLECLLGKGGRVTVRAGFDENILAASEAEGLVHRLEHVVAQFGSKASQVVPLARVEIASRSDAALLETFNPEVGTLEQCMHWMVEKQARLRPNAVAVDAWDVQLTFGQLLDYSDRLAGKLVQLGVGPETIVPFAFEKSGWTVVAMHAILRAGGACVALDMSHPRARHEKIVADTEARVIVASAKHAGSIDVVPNVVAVDHASLEALPPRPAHTRSDVTPRNAAFVVYSSGSTGTPKGSILEHRSLCSTSRTNAEILSVGHSTRAIGFASYSFDVAIEENIIIAMYGGCVCIPSDEERLNDLPGAMRRMKVNWADLTPTVGRMLNPDNVPCLKTLVLGGESLTKDIIDTWAGKIGLFNTYGPSECSIQCTSSKSLQQVATGANIGRAVNCKLWVVDAEDPNRLLPAGCVGELLIEGPIVGRGYLKEPTKTKAAFVTGLTWAAQAAGKKTTLTPRRFYRTGDLAKFNPDGTLDCLGRRDTQIKLHGQRIELGEIEYNITKQSSRPDSTTVAVEAIAPKGSSRKLLAAFIQSQDVNCPELVLTAFTDALRIQLEELKVRVGGTMPEYMVPSLFIPVDSLCMNTSGKIDRKKLREVASNFDQAQLSMYSLSKNTNTESKAALGSSTEQLLAELWAEVLHIDLGKDPIGANDSFLELGGDSISAMQLVGKAKAAGLGLSVPSIMKSTKLAAMAVAAKPISGVATRAPKTPAAPRSAAPPPKVAAAAKPALAPAPTHVPTPARAPTPAPVVRPAPAPKAAVEAPAPMVVSKPASPVMVKAAKKIEVAPYVPTAYSPFQLVTNRIPIAKVMKILRNNYDIERDIVEDIYPCTPLQEGLMALTASDSAAYVLRDIYTLPAHIDVDHFKASWAAVVRRNSILRTRLVFIEGAGTCQVVLDERLRWKHADSVEEYLARDNADAMTYGKPLSRWAIVDDGRTVKFVWTIHHALYDGYSLGMTLNAVDETYQTDLEVPESRPFLDFIRFLQATDKDAEKQFWTQQLSDLETAVFPQPPTGHQCQADNTVSYRIRLEKSRKVGLTTATILKAAWSVVVSRLSDAPDVVFGVTQFGRDVDLDEIDMMNGPTITTVPVRIRVDPEGSVRDFLAGVQSQSLEMTPFSHSGLQYIKKMSEAAQTACDFQNLLVIQPEEAEDEESLFRTHETATTASHLRGFGLVVECALGAGTITFSAHHDSKVIMPEQVERILRQFESVIGQLLAEPAKVRDIEMFSAADRMDLMTWNGTYPKDVDQCIHQIISEQADSTPNAPAIQSRLESISYKDMEAYTTDLAHRLRECGVGPERMVPICLEKSNNAILAMLAIQKAGGAFVPLNPQDPTDRLLDLIDQVEAGVIIFSEQTRHLMPTIAVGKKTIVLPAKLSGWSAPLNTRPVLSGATPENLAYALFTSGSTGRPKAVLIPHRTVSSSTAGHGLAMGFADYPRRALQFATYTFDACIAEIFTTLTHGGCICVPTEHERMNDLARFIRDLKCDWAFFTPSFVRLLKPEEVPCMKTVVLGGEALTKDCVDVWGDKVHLMNGYGPTETCVFCVTRTVPGNSQESRHKAETIGYPVSSIGWVVDANDHNRLVPVGCVGELLVQGPSLARGYLKNEEKTNEVFIPAPTWLTNFGYSASEMMYKTGDLVRQDVADGTLTYLGRKDNQTKVNGQRLELGEIETQISEKGTDIEAAVVLAGKTKLDAKKQVLAAFVEFADSAAMKKNNGNNNNSKDIVLAMDDTLRARLQALEVALRATLPKYMVPSLWVPVSRMPSMASSGKTDRKTLTAIFKAMEVETLTVYALAQPSESGKGGSRLPETEMEKVIVELVAKSLGREVETVHADDSFFRLGGDSIVAIQLVAAARTHQITLTTEDIFRQPVIADIARNAKTLSKASTESALAVIEPFSMLSAEHRDDIFSSITSEYGIEQSAVCDVLPCTPLQEGLITLTVKDSDAYVLREIYRLPARLDLDRFRAAFEVVVRDAAILRTRIVNLEAHGCFQVVMAGGLEWQSARSVKEHIDNDKAAPFKYGTALCKLALVETLYNGTYFVMTIHHALYDGWSKGLILQKVEEAYRSTAAQPALAAPTPPFNRFIQYLQGTDQSETRAYWKRQFSGLEAQPFPRVQAGQETILDRNHSLDIPLVRKAGSAFTTGTLLKAAWAIVLGRYTGSSDALFGVIQTGRNVPIDGVSDMIGPTITTVPLRVKLDSEMALSTFLQGIQDQATEMIKHEHTGLQNIARMGGECRDACAFSNIMVIQPGGQAEEPFLGAQRIQDQDKGFLRFGMGLECTLQDGAVQVTGAYDQRLLADSQMQRILHQFKAAVQQINLESGGAVSSIDLFSSEDWDEMVEMNRSVPSDVYENCHDMIHRMALERSGSIAVNAWDIDLTYGDLDSLSSRLAHHLRSLGVGPEVIVPLCFEKSGWAVVALLGVMKAGGAFVFLDPNYPIARLNEILSQTEATLILSSLATSSLWKHSGKTVQIVDNVAIESLPSVSGMPVTGVTPSNALYVIFTSGSTGKPKGCVIEHHSFLTCAAAQAQRGNITSESRILQGASYSFDVSVMEMLTALSIGACICVPNERSKSRSITDVINDFRITWAFLTPSVAKFMKPSDVPCLKTLVLGGEALTTHNVKTWAGQVQLMNGYGPSECTIAATANTNLAPDADPANIGTALGGVCWITDPEDHNKLAPLGTIGELLIEGPIVARGYLNNPEKTAEVFVEDPDWAEKKADGKVRRMYKTGDLAYFNTNGNIIFVGRKDTQVKVRGQRMELGEIETHLSLNKEIQHAMVMYPKAGLCKRKLVGIISLAKLGATTNSSGAVDLIPEHLRGEAAVEQEQVTTELSAIVPGYMVPQMWIVLESFPLLPSGKLNRKRVEQWLSTIPEETYKIICGLGESNAIQAPTTALETELRAIWAEVLKLPAEEIGTTQEFTALGGDSILAMVVIAKLRKKGSSISMQDMLKARNISKLASLIAAGPKTPGGMAAQKEVEETTDELFDLSPIQQFYANFTLKQTNYLSKQTNKRFNHTFCLRVKQAIDGADLGRALEALVERHSMLRARFVRDESASCGFRQYITAAGKDKGSKGGAESSSYRFRTWDNYTIDQVKPSIEKARLSLNLEKGPIMAADLVTVDSESQYFFIVAHHLVVDMMSWNSILRDLEDLLMHGECTSDKPYPFQAWARHQRDQAVKTCKPSIAYPLPVPQADYAYWGMDDRINIVRDTTHRAVVIPQKETAALMTNCAKQYGAEMMDLLVSSLSQAFSLVFRDRNTPAIYRYSHGREPAYLDNQVTGGASVDVASTVGWFSTLTPLHVRVGSRDDSLDVLRRAVESRRRVPANGWAYFASRYHHPDGPAAFAGHENMEVTVNYLGVGDGQMRNRMRLFEVPQNLEGGLGAEGQEVKCFSLFSISAEVSEGRLQIDCSWNRRARAQDEIEAWFTEFERCLIDVARRGAAGHHMRRRVAPGSRPQRARTHNHSHEETHLRQHQHQHQHQQYQHQHQQYHPQQVQQQHPQQHQQQHHPQYQQQQQQHLYQQPPQYHQQQLQQSQQQQQQWI